MKLYVYEYKSYYYIVISDNNTIGKRYGSNINEAVNEYFKESQNISPYNDHWIKFMSKNKPVLEIDSEINPEYFI